MSLSRSKLKFFAGVISPYVATKEGSETRVMLARTPSSPKLKKFDGMYVKDVLREVNKEIVELGRQGECYKLLAFKKDLTECAEKYYRRCYVVASYNEDIYKSIEKHSKLLLKCDFCLGRLYKTKNGFAYLRDDGVLITISAELESVKQFLARYYVRSCCRDKIKEIILSYDEVVARWAL